jgi:quercetin dioxygenase-like cupin family protein
VDALASKLPDIPDDTRWFEGGRVDIVHVAGVTIGRATLEPGWRWSHSIGHASHERWCWSTHVGYVVAGRLMVERPDGTTAEFVEGDAAVIPPGHDAWVVGHDEVVFVEFDAAATHELASR